MSGQVLPTMKPKSVNFTINLVPRDPFFESILGRTLKWALSVGRYLVIFTELVVIMSFATRFTLDRQVTDLNESLNQKKLVIESYGTLEKDFRTIQARMEDINQVDQQENIADIFPKLITVVPKEVQLDELSVGQNNVYLAGVAPSQESLNIFLNNLQLSKDFFSVTVDKIESRGEKMPGYVFSLRANTEAEAKVVTAKTPAVTPAAKSGTNPAAKDTGE
jgi:Tfp pilus assembly protein PilN